MRQRKRARKHQHELWEEFSFLFNLVNALELNYSERWLYLRKSRTPFVLSGAFVMINENPGEIIIRSQVRTNNRIRSPRLTASGR